MELDGHRFRSAGGRCPGLSQGVYSEEREAGAQGYGSVVVCLSVRHKVLGSIQGGVRRRGRNGRGAQSKRDITVDTQHSNHPASVTHGQNTSGSQQNLTAEPHSHSRGFGSLGRRLRYTARLGKFQGFALIPGQLCFTLQLPQAVSSYGLAKHTLGKQQCHLGKLVPDSDRPSQPQQRGSA